MAAQKYRVLAGIHIEKNPEYKGENTHHPDRFRTFKTGDEITSDRELDKIYVNKFERVVNKKPANVSELRKADVAQLLDTPSSPWTRDDKDFLESMDDKDFARILRITGVKPLTPPQERKVTSPLGDDVTDSFQRAYDENMKVFKNGAGKHQVTKSNSLKKPLNLQPLDAEEVDKFVETYVNG